MINKFPQTVFLTPDSWAGEDFYFDEKDLKEMVGELRKLGDDWADVSTDEAESLEFVQMVGDKAIYQNGISGFFIYVLGREIPEGGYKFINQYQSLEDAIYYEKTIHAAASALGSIRTKKKAAASRKNGKLGGRPKNK